MSKYQYPHISHKEKRILENLGDPAWLEWIFAAKKWRKYLSSSFLRALRTFSERYTHISFKGHIDLPQKFIFDENRSKPRGNAIEGKYYSSSYDLEFNELPEEVKELVLSFRSIIETYFACDMNIATSTCWRNKHIPQHIIEMDGEIISNAFHQDLVFDQYNLQLFILLQSTEIKHGPFEYLEPAIQSKEMQYYKKRNRKKALSESVKLTGKRGDFMLFTTGMTLHKAGVPELNQHRDIFSIAFFPSYSNIGTPISDLI